eukprot:12504692-Ditylum_brightwellii.AAC.1
MKTPAQENVLDGGRILWAKTSTLLLTPLEIGHLASSFVMQWVISLSWCDDTFCYWATADGPAHVVLGTQHK